MEAKELGIDVSGLTQGDVGSGDLGDDTPNIDTGPRSFLLQERLRDMSDVPDLSREELKAHFEANEERVGRMTDRVENKLDNLSTQIDTKIGSLEEKQTITRNIVIGVGTTILLAVIALFTYAMNQTNEVEDRVFENTRRIEQVAPQSQSEGPQSQNSSSQSQPGQEEGS